MNKSGMVLIFLVSSLHLYQLYDVLLLGNKDFIQDKSLVFFIMSNLFILLCCAGGFYFFWNEGKKSAKREKE